MDRWRHLLVSCSKIARDVRGIVIIMALSNRHPYQQTLDSFLEDNNISKLSNEKTK